MSQKIEQEVVQSTREYTYDKLSASQCLGVGVGGIPDIGMQYAMKNMANPIFNVIYGVNPILIGIAFALPRFWEIFIDPWIGAMSDRTQCSMGRRHPYMIIGGIFGFLTFAVVWFVPSWMTPTMAGWWLIFFALAHFSAYSFFMVPFQALLSEVSMVPEQRMKLMSFRIAFVNVGVLLMGWLYWLAQRSCFSNAAEGMKIVGIGFGLLLLLGAIIPTLVCKKNRKYHAVGNSSEAKIKEFSALKELWRIRPFRGILIAIFCQVAGGLLVSNLGFYITLCFIFPGDTKSVAVLGGIVSTVNCLSVILFCPAINYCAKKFGEKYTLYISVYMTSLGYALTYWAATPQHPYWTIGTGVLGSIGMNAFWIILPSLTGELGRQHELETGHSVYGLFSAMLGMAIKIGASVGLFFAGMLVDLSGYHISHGVHQSESTIFMMRFLNSVVPTASMLLALYFLYTIFQKQESKVPLRKQ